MSRGLLSRFWLYLTLTLTLSAWSFAVSPSFGAEAVLPASAVISFSPSSLDFGNQRVGVTSDSRTITVTNTGADLLTLSKIYLTGPNHKEFTQTNTCRSSLASGESCGV